MGSWRNLSKFLNGTAVTAAQLHQRHVPRTKRAIFERRKVLLRVSSPLVIPKSDADPRVIKS